MVTPLNSKRFMKNTLLVIFSALIITAIVFEGNYGLKATYIPAQGDAPQLFANQVDNDLRETYVAAIENAKHSILLVVYSITDPHIIASLSHKAEQGLDVRVICDAKTSPNIERKLGSKVHNTRRFGAALMHQKILVIDKEYVWIGSANMTTESLRMHGNLVVAIKDKSLGQLLTSQALALPIEGLSTPTPPFDFFAGGQKMEFWSLPSSSNAVGRLKQLILSAQKTARVAMFTWTRRDLAQALIAVKNRGVQAEVVIDSSAGKGAGAEIVKLLKKNGVPVFLSRSGPLLHHKFLYIDSHLLVNGSANWTLSAFTKNDDCFLVITGLNQKQRDLMEALWKTIRQESIPVN